MKKPGDDKRSPDWPKVRAAHLSHEPTCRACAGVDQLEVHHIKPFHLYPELELDPDNLVTLCEHPAHDCHFRVGHFLDWRAINPYSVADADRFRGAMTVAHAAIKEDQ